MRTHEEGERNIEGESLLDMCNRNDWVMVGSKKEKLQDNMSQLR
jgi:hypothetical protein